MTEQSPAVVLEGPAKFVFDQFIAECDRPGYAYSPDLNLRVAYIMGAHAMALRWLGVYFQAGAQSKHQHWEAVFAMLAEVKRRTIAIYEEDAAAKRHCASRFVHPGD